MYNIHKNYVYNIHDYVATYTNYVLGIYNFLAKYIIVNIKK